MPRSHAKDMSNLTKLITAGSYLAGLGFSFGAVMKFKQHRENPSKVPLVMPLTLAFLAGAVLLFPTLMDDTEEEVS